MVTFELYTYGLIIKNINAYDPPGKKIAELLKYLDEDFGVTTAKEVAVNYDSLLINFRNGISRRTQRDVQEYLDTFGNITFNSDI